MAGAGAAGRLRLVPAAGQPAEAGGRPATLSLRGLVCFGLKDLWYDHNLLNLQAKGLESVELEKSLLQSDCGASFAMVMAKSREEVVARKAMYADRESLPDG